MPEYLHVHCIGKKICWMTMVFSELRNDNNIFYKAREGNMLSLAPCCMSDPPSMISSGPCLTPLNAIQTTSGCWLLTTQTAQRRSLLNQVIVILEDCNLPEAFQGVSTRWKRAPDIVVNCAGIIQEYEYEKCIAVNLVRIHSLEKTTLIKERLKSL